MASSAISSLYYDSTWDQTPVSQAVGAPSIHSANGPVYINGTHMHT